MKKDLLSMPAESFFWNRITPRERQQLSLSENKEYLKPYSLILSQATVKDFRKLHMNTSSFYSCDNEEFIHFSLFDCCALKSLFRNNQVLTVNTATGNYKWRKPYNKRTLPK
jgi:hypothetical protein